MQHLAMLRSTQNEGPGFHLTFHEDSMQISLHLHGRLPYKRGNSNSSTFLKANVISMLLTWKVYG